METNNDTLKKVTKNTGYLFFSDVITKIIAFFTSIYLARYLGVEYYGTYNFIIVYLTFLGVISVFGLDTVVLRDVARNEKNATYIMNNVFYIRIITAIVAITISIVLIKYITPSENLIIYVIITSIILLFQSLSYLSESLFKAKQKMEYYAYNIVTYKLSFAIFIFVVIYLKLDFLYVLLALIISELIRSFLGYWYSKNLFEFNLKYNSKYWKYLISEALPFVANGILFIIHYRIDVIMLSIIADNIAVGLYSAAYKLTDPLLFVPSAISVSLFPIISKQSINKKEAMEKTFIQGTRIIFLIVLPMTVGIFLLSEQFISLTFGKQYVSSALVLQILIGSLLFNALNYMQASVLISTNNQKLITASVAISCSINIILNWLLIPIYSYIGAAVATLISVIFLYSIQLLFIFQKLKIHANSNILRPISCALIMGLFIYTLKEHNIVLIIVTSILIYLFSLVLLKAFTKEDIELLKNIGQMLKSKFIQK